jgi:hypothetical protein
LRSYNASAKPLQFMKQTILIVLGLAAAFAAGTYFRREPTPPAPLTNGTDKPADPEQARKSAEAAARKMQELNKQSGPQVPIPDPTPEEFAALTTGKPLENRSFKELTPEQAAILKDALAQLGDPNLTEEAAMKILELAASNYGPQILDITKAALKHPSEKVRIRALKLIQRNGDPGILAVAKEAMNDPVAHVRLSALTALEQQRGPQVTEIFKSALKDRDKDVMLGAVNSAANLPPGQAAEILGEAITACPTEGGVYAVTCLMGLGTKESVNALIRGLRSSDEEVKVNAEHAFLTLAQELPENPEQWWAENQKNFDDEMTPIIDGQPNEPIPEELLQTLPGAKVPPTK